MEVGSRLSSVRILRTLIPSPPFIMGGAGRWVGRCGRKVKGMRPAGRALHHGMGPAPAGPRCWERPRHRTHPTISLRTGQPPAPGPAMVLCLLCLCFTSLWGRPLCSSPFCSHSLAQLPQAPSHPSAPGSFPPWGGHRLPPEPCPHCPGPRGLSPGIRAPPWAGPSRSGLPPAFSQLAWYSTHPLYRGGS